MREASDTSREREVCRPNMDNQSRSRQHEISRRHAVDVVILIYLIIVLDGVLRKYLFPNIQRELAFLRDPIVLYLYHNLVHHYGVGEFIRAAAEAGVDGLLVLDLPPEESDAYESLMKTAGLCVIYLVAPTTPDERIGLIVKRGAGFVYYVSREGVTGMQTKVAETIAMMTARIRAHTDLPIAVGFGISNPEQARSVAATAEAVVVGSAVVNQIAEHGKSPDLVRRVASFTETLIRAVKKK